MFFLFVEVGLCCYKLPSLNCFSCIIDFGLSHFCYNLFLDFFISSLIIFSHPVGYLEVYCLASMCLCFLHIFFHNLYQISYCCGQKRIWMDTISVFLNSPQFDLWPKMWSILQNILCAFEKKMYSAVSGWNIQQISVRSFGLMCHLRLVFPY